MRSDYPVEGVVLFHFPPSLCSQKVRLALAEKAVSYTSRSVNIGPPMENYEPWYARLNPGLVVPTLVVDGEVITNSARIVVEVDARFDGPDLGAAREDVQRWISLQDGLQIREIAYGRQSGVLGFLTKGSFERRQKLLTKHRDENPDLAPVYEARLADVAAWRRVSSTPAEIDTRREQVFDALRQVEAGLGSGVFLAGDTYSLADVVWTVMLARLTFMGFTEHFGERTRAYYQRMHARPTFESADVWERLKPLAMAKVVTQVLAMRLGLG